MESAEHVWIGDQITLNFHLFGSRPAKDVQLGIDGGHSLTYGQLIALGGDLYGIPDAPISTSDNHGVAFVNAWHTLTTADPKDVRDILDVMDVEIAAVEKSLALRQQPSETAYKTLGDSLSARWNRLTGGGSIFSDFLPPGRYLQLSSTNWDHFNTFAYEAYRVGHDNAMFQARLASQEHEDVQDAYLMMAYAMNAFADHFLTDLFSAGHLRAPRKALTDMLDGRGWRMLAGPAGGLLTRSMHDEDSAHGLQVKNKDGRHWRAFGDKRLLDSVSAANREEVTKAVQASADDVWRAFLREGSHNTASQYIPDLEAVLDVSSDKKQADYNSSPLFVARNGVVLRRSDMSNKEDFTWTPDWDPADTLAELWGGHPYTKVRAYNPVTKASLGWLTKGGNNYLQLTDQESGVHPCSWYVTSGGDLYLRKQTSGGPRYLGREYSNADWELKGSPVVYNDDATISLRDDPTRKLYVGDDSWIYWSSDDSHNANLLAIDLPLGPVITN